MHDELHQLKAQFIVQSDLAANELAAATREIMKYCQIDAKGHVEFARTTSLKLANKLLLVLLARYLAVELGKKTAEPVSFGHELNITELAASVGSTNEIVSARVKELKDKHRVEKTATGKYVATPLAAKTFSTEMAEGSK